MHILLTDVLQCPRCGPGSGLILLADVLDDRRVAEGRLGCANCRQEYPIRGGEADLRPLPGTSVAALPRSGEPETSETDDALRLAAMLGVTEGPGMLLLAGGPGAMLAPAVAALVPGVEVVVLEREASGGARLPVSKVVAGAALPFRDRTARGVALTDEPARRWLGEGLRVLAPGARLVVQDAPPDLAAELRHRDLDVLLDEEGTVVASRGRTG